MAASFTKINETFKKTEYHQEWRSSLRSHTFKHLWIHQAHDTQMWVNSHQGITPLRSWAHDPQAGSGREHSPAAAPGRLKGLGRKYFYWLTPENSNSPQYLTAPANSSAPHKKLAKKFISASVMNPARCLCAVAPWEQHWPAHPHRATLVSLLPFARRLIGDSPLLARFQDMFAP